MSAKMRAALDAASHGLRVVPCWPVDAKGRCTCAKRGKCISPGKHPIGSLVRHGKDDATADEKTIRRWWRARPKANVGVVPGSAGFVVGDPDVWKGQDRILAELEDEHEALPRGCVVLTGQHEVDGEAVRSEHIWLRLPEGTGFKNTTIKGIEFKSDGIVIYPGSDHWSGVKYEFANGSSPQDAGEAPAWVLNGATGHTSGETQDGERGRTGLRVGRRSLDAMRNGLPEPKDGQTHREVAVGIARNFYEAGYHEDAVRSLMAQILGHENSALDQKRPWTAEDVEDIVASVVRSAAPDARQVQLAGEEHGPGSCTDLGNARRFARRFSDQLRYVPQERKWLTWQDGRWRRDALRDAHRAAKQVARDLFAEASQVRDADVAKAVGAWAAKSHAEPRIAAMLALACTEPEIVLSAEALDTDPWLLTCGNGTLDLRTGDLRSHAPDDLITRGTDVAWDPDADCPRWRRFLHEVFDGDDALVTYVWKFLGYCLTGDTREQMFIVLHGTGRNGKSTLIDVSKQLLGSDLGLTAAFDTFMRQRDPGKIRNDLARLHGARLVVAAESNEGRRLDEATVKLITGGDAISVRFLHKEFFEFTPGFKLVLVTNNRPRIEGSDEAIWRRIKLVPFNVSFTGDRDDRELKDKLLQELPGILTWAVEGCLKWQAEGLGDAKAVEDASRAYRQVEDILGSFLAERCVMKDETEVAIVRSAYERYCAELNEEPMTASVFGKGLAKRGVASYLKNGRRYYPMTVRGAIKVRGVRKK